LIPQERLERNNTSQFCSWLYIQK